MSVDSRLQYLWKPQLVEGEPPPQQVPPSIASQGHTQGSGDSSPQGLPPRVGIGHPVGSIPPTEEAEARAQRAEYRDERRLCVEIIALVVGFFGFVGLLLALYESWLATEAALQSMVTAREQMELSERPWISVVDVMLPHPGPAEMRKRVEDLCERMRVGVLAKRSWLRTLDWSPFPIPAHT